ncbi:hypothetical protein B2J93_7021 [Marssonina coronariae]|uniref:Peptide hydrolase n=1 Tax=Diplocarpon coronariae TaxID=2795749 RepID=A0A218Z0E3_9HELO|nr:hypothetical protein B2J93_7021 [Marssonina coronariae]
MWNVITHVNGTNEDETIVVGNHCDTWIIGGAGDPNSDSAIPIELAKALGKLLKSGCKPRRTIVLASWDAEEYRLVGSIKWAEEYVNWLNETTLAYLNVNGAVSHPPRLSPRGRRGLPAGPGLGGKDYERDSEGV